MTMPAQIPSQVQTQAFKKLVLTALLIDGKFIPFKGENSHVPSYTSPVLRQSFKFEATAYLDFANAFETLDPFQIQKEYKKYYDVFSRQGNLGLVNQVLESYLVHLQSKII